MSSWRRFLPRDWEAPLSRGAFAALIALEARIPQGLAYPTAPHPEGIARWIDLTVPTAAAGSLQGLFWLALITYVSGWMLPLSSVLLGIFCLVAGVLESSQGSLNHGKQILSLIFFAQCGAYLWAHRMNVQKRFAEGHRLSMLLCSQIVAYVYVTSAISKLRAAGLAWIHDSPNVAVEITRIHSEKYFDTLNTSLLQKGDDLAALILQYPNVIRGVMGASLFVELFAFVGLFNKRWGLFTALVLVSVHFGIKQLMTIDFRIHQYCLLLFMGHLPFWALWAGQKIKPKLHIS